jgi:hypothetical protein
LNESIIDISRLFFEQIVHPILREYHPEETAQTAFGVFGYGSEALRLDDEYSRDHHWGLRIDALMPQDIFETRREAIAETLRTQLPESFAGHSLREAHLAGAGLAPDNLTSFLQRTIGLDHAPASFVEWLRIPEEDIIHVINGEVWHDPLGKFSKIREVLNRYYPEPVRLRRIAHWCRYFSGMGTYALKRAILRDNNFYATTRFSNAIRLGVQLAFLLDKVYFPYDKWLMVYFERLPRLAAPLLPFVNEAVLPSTSWEHKLELLHQIAEILDQTMVDDGLIQPHPKFMISPTSGYRLLEHAYAEIIQTLPDEIKRIVPVWDQIYLEEFHSGFVDSLDLETWDEMIQLKEEGHERQSSGSGNLKP